MKAIKNITYGELNFQKLDIYLPENKKFNLFIYFHGGGIESGDKTEIETCVDYLIDNNIAIISADYRLYPTATYPEYLRDAAAVVGWAKNNISQYGECEKIYIGGSSAGGYISMMLCFDNRYLAPYGINPAELGGFVHNAGQPTVHFNILKETGRDIKQVIIDERAPLYHIGKSPKYAPMLFIVSDNDLPSRYEQTMLTLSTLRHFEYDMETIKLIVMHTPHCEYVTMRDENNIPILGKMIADFISKF